MFLPPVSKVPKMTHICTYSAQICKHTSTGNAGTMVRSMDNMWALVKLWVLSISVYGREIVRNIFQYIIREKSNIATSCTAQWKLL